MTPREAGRRMVERELEPRVDAVVKLAIRGFPEPETVDARRELLLDLLAIFVLGVGAVEAMVAELEPPTPARRLHVVKE